MTLNVKPKTVCSEQGFEKYKVAESSGATLDNLD